MSLATLIDRDENQTVAPPTQYSAVSASKAMQLLRAFRGATGPLGVSELARRAGTSKSTAFRLLSALAQHGFIDRVGPRYELSWQMFELGNQVRARRAHQILQFASPVLAELYSTVKHSVQLIALEGDTAVVIDGIRCHDAVPQVPHVSDRVAAHATAAGKALLAFSGRDQVMAYLGQGLEGVTPSTIRRPQALIDDLNVARRDGYARTLNEWRQGLAEVAAPVIIGGRAVAAISVSLPALPALPARYAGAVRNAASQVARVRDLVA